MAFMEEDASGEKEEVVLLLPWGACLAALSSASSITRQVNPGGAFQSTASVTGWPFFCRISTASNGGMLSYTTVLLVKTSPWRMAR
jgi:hypothetical protein